MGVSAQLLKPHVAIEPYAPVFLDEAVRHAVQDQLGDVIKRAKARHVYPWWESDDPYVIFRGQLNEPVLLVPFDRLLNAADLVLGRLPQPWEFFHPEKLLAELDELMP